MAQLIRQNRVLATYIYAEYVQKALSPSVSRLSTLICDLLGEVSDVRICIDGIDECAAKDLLAKFSTIVLDYELQSIGPAIKSYVHESLSEIRCQLQCRDRSEDLIQNIEHDLVHKSEGTRCHIAIS